jgi:hypothetical protein
MSTHVEPPSTPPESWRVFRLRSRHACARPFLWIEWIFARTAWCLSRWSFLKVLEYAETFSVLIALIFWVSESHERTQQKHYQAWQVINTAQGKGGSGGRVDALEQLNNDHVPLVGVDVAEAFLQDVGLDKAELRRANFRAADIRRAHFRRAQLEDANFTFANLREARLDGADLTNASFPDADLNGATLAGARVSGVTLDRADLRNSDLSDLKDWQSIASIKLANIQGIKNAPEGFAKWVLAHGAVQIPDTAQWNAAIAAHPEPK